VTAIKLELNRDVNAAYVVLSDDEVRKTKKLDQSRLLDLDAQGEVVGIEFLNISAGANLSDLPRGEELRKLFGEHHITQFA
jgi:uncharacterized protein YuzE